MTLTQLSYVVAVDTYRHFGRAAEHACVSQPTLSMQIQKLEEELGVQLFDRTKKPVLPTDIGEKVAEQARVVLREAERIRDLLAEAEATLAGDLTLGIIPTLSPYVLPLVTGTFAKRYPRISVTVREMPTRQILELLATDRLDAGLIATQEDRPGLIQRPLFTEPFVAYVSDQHRLSGNSHVSADELSASDLWLLSEGHCFRDQVLQLCGTLEQTGPANPIRFESGSLETLRLLVDEAGGMTLLPHLATRSLGEAAAQHLRPFSDPVPQRTVYLIYGRAYLKRALIEAYVNVLLEAVTPLLP